MSKTAGWLGFGCLWACAFAACGSNSTAPKQVKTILATSFTSDPTLQDSNSDGVLDWVIRDRESDHFAQDAKLTIQNGVFHSEGPIGGDCLDARPRMDYPNHTELVWSVRSLDNNDFAMPTVGQLYTGWPWIGAQTWINFEYDVPNMHYAALFTVIYRRATDQVLFVVNQVDDAPGSTSLIFKILYVQAGLPPDDFVDVKLHLYIPEEMVGITVNGIDHGKVAYERKVEGAPKDDRFITIFPPQGTSEWKSLTVQVAEP
jgi:hypothetical protein